MNSKRAVYLPATKAKSLWIFSANHFSILAISSSLVLRALNRPSHAELGSPSTDWEISPNPLYLLHASGLLFARHAFRVFLKEQIEMESHIQF